MTQLIRVIIADDHPIILSGTGVALANHAVVKVVGKAANSTELIKLLKSTPCDIVITDFVMPGGIYGDGLRLIKYIVQHFPHIKIIVHTMLENTAIIRQLQNAGVQGVINKGDSTNNIGIAVTTVMGNNLYYPSVEKLFYSGGFSKRGTGEPKALSDRENEVVRLFAGGDTIKGIANKLNRSVKTISTQKVCAMQKLGLKSDVELYQYALETHLLNKPASMHSDSESTHNEEP